MLSSLRVVTRRAPHCTASWHVRGAVPACAFATCLHPNAPSPLQEFSVVYTDRALNHMSEPFQKVMLDINRTLKDVYKAESCAVIPGGGTYGMEAVARQFATKKHVLVIRNGYFSFRWTQILEQCDIPKTHTVLSARCVSDDCSVEPQYAPPAIEKVVRTILEEKPAVVFAPHVETSTGSLLPDSYVRQVAVATKKVGGLFVLDCIASGVLWVDMKDLGVDVLITAPQKGWTGPACAGLVLLSEAGTEAARRSTSTSFTCDLRKWLEVMDAYEAGGHMYHATMPTDALMTARDLMLESEACGFSKLREQAWELGKGVRKLLCEERKFVSVAAPGFESPTVVVVHHEDPAVVKKFAAVGTQIAAGVPFKIGEPETAQTFRIGLFGLDKLADPSKTIDNLRQALNSALPP